MKTRAAFWVISGLLAMAIIAFACSSTRAPEGTTTGQRAAQVAGPVDKTQPEKHVDEDFSISCYECHADVTQEVVQAWSDGMHGQVNVGCFICHGDGQSEFHARPGGETCATCHAGHDVDFSTIPGITSCFTCHGGHDLKFHGERKGGFGAALPGWLPPAPAQPARGRLVHSGGGE